MDIPYITHPTFHKLETRSQTYWEKTLREQLQVTSKLEVEAAIAREQIDSINSIPYTTVILDGEWSERSYRKNDNALSGAAVIIGALNKKVLFMDVKNKYCVTCVRNQNKGSTPPVHNCTANFSGPSTKMESEIILDGFLNSVKNCGMRFLNFIGDGDSSKFNKILEANPYQGVIYIYMNL